MGRETKVFKDAYGRTLHTRETLGSGTVSTRISWNLTNNIVIVTDPGNNVWSYTWDSLGRRTQVNDPDLGVWTFAYNAAGQLTQQTDAKAQKTTFTYDALGRVLTKISRQGEPDAVTTTNTYDTVRPDAKNIGYLTSATNGSATREYDYDEGGRLKSDRWLIDAVSGEKTTAYHPGGQILYKTWPDGTSTGSAANPWTYDTAGRLAAIPGLITSMAYNAAGQSKP